MQWSFTGHVGSNPILSARKSGPQAVRLSAGFLIRYSDGRVDGVAASVVLPLPFWVFYANIDKM